MSKSELKYFTPKEAKRTLPLVKRIVSDILQKGDELRLLLLQVESAPDENPQVQELFIEINNFTAELEELGCFYKDWNFTIGLVDFPSVIDDEEVMLCWKSDEPDILFYHSINEGFAGRKPIPELLLA